MPQVYERLYKFMNSRLAFRSSKVFVAIIVLLFAFFSAIPFTFAQTEAPIDNERVVDSVSSDEEANETQSSSAADTADDTTIKMPGLSINIDSSNDNPAELANGLKILLVLTVLSLAPSILIVMTSFTRIIIVLSMLRHAIGMQQTPPNTVIISLALFLTFFNMMPTFEQIQDTAFQPYLNGNISTQEAIEKSKLGFSEFMIRQTREQDIALMLEIADKEPPDTIEDISLGVLIPAYMLSELKSAFQIGFVIFMPFLLIDIIVAAILMSMGMLMVPPMMISLPIKVLMFVLIDGWYLVVSSLINSFA